ncbi:MULTISPECIES: hypothetical protein [unclassified Streptomyces]|uniref:hypothetical protein n=1 Tax=unclassified Streptomyces TaxID=2593676 RepID=UPI002E320308|nr:hypothetical protein [Streptomyces sp. NBC_01358]
MNVVWVGTSPESGPFSPVETHSEAEDLSGRFYDLRSHSQGYIEVRLPNRVFPVLALAFRDDHAVVHLMSDAERTFLLVGDGTAPSGDEVQVPIMDDLVTFTGDYVLDVNRAWNLVHDFWHTQAVGALGEWCEL